MDANHNSEYHYATNGEVYSPRGKAQFTNGNDGAISPGDEIPSWKRQIQETKIKKERERRAEEFKEEQRRRSLPEIPDWKRAIIIKRQELMMTSDDPYLVLKRRIQVLDKECQDSKLPPWKIEVLQRKLQKLKDELAQMEEEKIKASFKAGQR